MATIAQMIRTVEKQLDIEVNEVDVLIASYLCHGLGQKEICELLSIEESELSELINETEFQQIRQIIQLDLAKSKQDIDGGWDSMERQAVKAINEHIESGIGGLDEAIRIASIANKAERRSKNQTTAIGGQQGGVLTLSLSQVFIQKIQNGGVQATLPGESAQVINGESIPMDKDIFVEQDKKVNGVPNGSATNLQDGGLESLGYTLRPDAGELESVLNLESAVKSQGMATQETEFVDSIFKAFESAKDKPIDDASYVELADATKEISDALSSK